MLTATQTARFAAELGVAEAQVRLDHLLSHLLSALATGVGVGGADDDSMVLIGGTALCRTHLTTPPWRRVSEDLDLLVLSDRAVVAQWCERALPVALHREFPDAAWVLGPTRARSPAPALFQGGGASVRVQLLPVSGGWAAWRRVPRERRAVDLRYPDTPGSVDLLVPTLEGFAAMKLLAWEERQAERDLFDLTGLTALQAFTTTTVEVFSALGARPPDPRRYQRLPTTVRERWHDQLAHQTPDLPEPDDCLRRVAAAVDAALGAA